LSEKNEEIKLLHSRLDQMEADSRFKLDSVISHIKGQNSMLKKETAEKDARITTLQTKIDESNKFSIVGVEKVVMES
jgi:predicted RNase H-like nuclease (RuvC/YqgF family)